VKRREEGRKPQLEARHSRPSSGQQLSLGAEGEEEGGQDKGRGTAGCDCAGTRAVIALDPVGRLTLGRPQVQEERHSQLQPQGQRAEWRGGRNGGAFRP
jgi:hypothetical protein